MSLLDPRFRYVPAVATDVTATWRRFGFDPQQNEERRARLKRPDALREANEPGTAAILALVKPKC
jgi:hypothetical protein